MQAYQVLDPDWDDQQPITKQANTPVGAVELFYTETLLELAPGMYAERVDPGCNWYTRTPQFFVTEENGDEYVVYFDHQ